eukprot:1859442-Amphidinium_carterae.1
MHTLESCRFRSEVWGPHAELSVLIPICLAMPHIHLLHAELAEAWQGCRSFKRPPLPRKESDARLTAVVPFPRDY